MMKPLEEYIEINHYFGLSKDFLDIIPKEETTKRKLNELNDMRAENTCASKDTINEVKDNSQ